MKKQLTADQISYLFSFAESKHVKYKDIQYEIVDHLASAIEAELDAYPFLTFERATERVYGRFPLTGFMQWMEQKEESLTKYWKGRQRKYMLRFLKLPQVVAVFTCIYAMAEVFQSQNTVLIIGLLCTYLAAILGCTWHNRFIYSHQQACSQYMVQDTFYKSILACSFTGTLLPLVLLLDSAIGSIFDPMSLFHAYYFSTAMTFIILYCYAAATAFPTMLQQELESKYSFLTTTT